MLSVLACDTDTPCIAFNTFYWVDPCSASVRSDPEADLERIIYGYLRGVEPVLFITNHAS